MCSPYAYHTPPLNLLNIPTAGIQNVLLLMLAIPTALVSVKQPRAPLTIGDYALAALALVDIALEFTADNQQYAFQTYKHAFLAKEKGDTSVAPYDPAKQWPGSRLNWTPTDARRGFVTRGLWAYVRHPNFACEQTFWVRRVRFPDSSAKAHHPHLSGSSRFFRSYLRTTCFPPRTLSTRPASG